MSPSRRDFLRLWAGAALCPDAMTGRLVGTVPFADDERRPTVHTRLGEGLDARLYTDLSGLTADSLVTPAAKFFVRTGAPDLTTARVPWTIRITGRTNRPAPLSVTDVDREAEPAGPFVTECAGNTNRAAFGLVAAATWSGVPLVKLLEPAQPIRRATRVRVGGLDPASRSSSSVPGASWIFSLDQLASTGALLVTRMNGQPLARDHGAPARLIVPGWYGCTCIKWVDEIAFVDDAEPSTSHMQEFAARTHQDGVPALARDFAPASMDLTAFPIRIEKWRVDGTLTYRVVGVVWGGDRPATKLRIRFKATEAFQTFDVCPAPPTPLMWSLWSYVWRPAARGRYEIVVKAGDPVVRSTRLDLYFYVRQVWIDET